MSPAPILLRLSYNCIHLHDNVFWMVLQNLFNAHAYKWDPPYLKYM
jgi:hypothetical protein